MTDDSDTSAPSSGPSENAKALDLSFAETRVLGCLLEKEATTPDQYPLTLNALLSACNQSSNRDPVVAFDTPQVEQALEDLRYHHLAMLVHQAGARVGKYRHTLDQRLSYLSDGQRALLCVLLLRGQQTAGELRQRSERLHRFADVDAVEEALAGLERYVPWPLVKQFPAGGGRRVPSYAHCLSGEPAPETAAATTLAAAPSSETPAAGSTWREALESRVADLEQEVSDLKSQLDQLRADLGA